MFDNLASHSKAKYLNVVQLYWRAYNFFKHFNLHLQFNSVYMGLGKEDYWNRRYYYKETVYSKSVIDNYASIVRCGELEVYRLYSEVRSGADCVWVFPFDENLYTDNVEENNENNKKIKSYLLQFNHDSIIALKNSMKIDHHIILNKNLLNL
jgi:hypothetical protein